MQGIRPQKLTHRELLDYAHLTGYDKLSAEWVVELATRLEAWVRGDETSVDDRYDEGYEAGHAEGYDTGYTDGANDAEDDGK
jgi:flagellar biosynthesis/type III secretory pathway protein FliH